MGLVGSLEKQEAAYPTVMEILQKASFKTAFFHGTWDSETPIFHTWAAERLLTQTKSKDQIHFRYFPRLGHGLDPRKAPLDFQFQPSDPAALETLAKDLMTFL